MTNTVRAESVAARVREALADAGISINRLADLTGIPYPTLRRHIKVTPALLTLDELNRIADATGADFAFLASGLQVAA